MHWKEYLPIILPAEEMSQFPAAQTSSFFSLSV